MPYSHFDYWRIAAGARLSDESFISRRHLMSNIMGEVARNAFVLLDCELSERESGEGNGKVGLSGFLLAD